MEVVKIHRPAGLRSHLGPVGEILFDLSGKANRHTRFYSLDVPGPTILA